MGLAGQRRATAAGLQSPRSSPHIKRRRRKSLRPFDPEGMNLLGALLGDGLLHGWGLHRRLGGRSGLGLPRFQGCTDVYGPAALHDPVPTEMRSRRSTHCPTTTASSLARKWEEEMGTLGATGAAGAPSSEGSQIVFGLGIRLARDAAPAGDLGGMTAGGLRSCGLRRGREAVLKGSR
jgi:hypothetical protein